MQPALIFGISRITAPSNFPLFGCIGGSENCREPAGDKRITWPEISHRRLHRCRHPIPRCSWTSSHVSSVKFRMVAIRFYALLNLGPSAFLPPHIYHHHDAVHNQFTWLLATEMARGSTTLFWTTSPVRRHKALRRLPARWHLWSIWFSCSGIWEQEPTWPPFLSLQERCTVSLYLCVT